MTLRDITNVTILGHLIVVHRTLDVCLLLCTTRINWISFRWPNLATVVTALCSSRRSCLLSRSIRLCSLLTCEVSLLKDVALT